MNFSLQQLRYFCAVVEAGSLGRAARLVHVSQPALTKSIHKLEDGVGLRLFDRGGAMKLTSAGREFLAKVRRMMEESGEMERLVTRLKRAEDGHVVIGCGPMMPEAFVAPAVSALLRRGEAPQVTIEIGGYMEFAGGLRGGHLDFFVANVTMIEDAPDLKVYAFPDEEAVWVARPGHPLAGRRRVPAVSFFGYPMAGPELPVWVDRWFQRHSGATAERPFHLAVTCSHYPTLKAIVAGSDCVGGAIPSVIREDLKDGRLVRLDVDLPPLVMRAGVVTLRHRELSPSARMVVDSIQRLVESGGLRTDPASGAPAAKTRAPARKRGTSARK